MTYWHGGRTIRGEYVLPVKDARSGPADGWVYVTPVRNLAATYAATCRGWLYEVEPIGVVENDPSSILPPGKSLRCRSARIVRRYRLSRAEMERRANVVGRLFDT